ncbi:MAG TPA: ABC transporter substrate-binding protein [Gammaproteobacteria bacterium]|jgi:phospholipid transport system substrate-binding protein|nr:ABC transporter substrate-binding protein [Gammaproteobacteria bacterium]
MRKILLAVLFLLIPALPALAGDAPAAGGALPPDQIIQQTAKELFDTVNSKKAELQKNPQELYSVVGGILLPRFDFEYASRLVLGQAWRNATPEQRKAFQDAFYKYLVHSYADALLKGNYTQNNVQVSPWQQGADASQARVRTKVLRDNGAPVEVDYVLTNKSGSWKAFDVTIEGISYVLNYRNQFGPEVQKSGLDELIKRLNTESANGTVQAPSKAND